MRNDFDAWNKIKKRIDSDTESSVYFPTTGEVWMCLFGKNIGSEQNGGGNNFSRPALIIKKFNNQMYWVLPLSTKQKHFDFYFNFTDPKGNAVSAILAQLKLASVKRLKRKLYQVSLAEIQLVKDRLKALM